MPHSQLLLTCKRKLSQTNGISSKIWGPFCRLKTKKPYLRSLTSPRILKTECVYVTFRPRWFARTKISVRATCAPTYYWEHEKTVHAKIFNIEECNQYSEIYRRITVNEWFIRVCSYRDQYLISIFDAKSYQNRPEDYQRARSARKLCLGARVFRARRKINHRGLLYIQHLWNGLSGPFILHLVAVNEWITHISLE